MKAYIYMFFVAASSNATCRPQLAVQALEALRKLRTEKMAEVKEFKLRLEHLRTHKDNAARLRKEVQDGEAQERKLLDHIRAIEEQLTQLQQV